MPNPNWKPGVSGNPRGRPKAGQSFSELLEKELKKKKYTIRDENGEHRVNGKEAIIRAHLAIIFSKSSSDDVKLRAIESLYDRCDGRPKQAVEHSGSIESPKYNIILEGCEDGSAPPA